MTSAVSGGGSRVTIGGAYGGSDVAAGNDLGMGAGGGYCSASFSGGLRVASSSSTDARSLVLESGGGSEMDRVLLGNTKELQVQSDVQLQHAMSHMCVDQEACKSVMTISGEASPRRRGTDGASAAERAGFLGAPSQQRPLADTDAITSLRQLECYSADIARRSRTIKVVSLTR